MKPTLPGLVLALLPILPAAPPARCTDTPVKVTFAFSYTDPLTGAAYQSALYSDGAALVPRVYEDGVDRVSAVVACASGDLLLDLSRATRAFGWDFRNLIPTSLPAPAWTSNPTLDPFFTKGNLTIRNLNYGFGTFTTRLGASITGPDGKTYLPRMVNAGSIAFTEPATPAANVPYATSLVYVIRDSAKWTIFPDTAGSPNHAVVSLMQDAKSGLVNLGQFRMPFLLVVEPK